MNSSLITYIWEPDHYNHLGGEEGYTLCSPELHLVVSVLIHYVEEE